MQSKTLVVVPGGKVWATRQQADVLEALTNTRKGGFARVYGYKPASNYEVPPGSGYRHGDAILDRKGL